RTNYDNLSTEHKYKLFDLLKIYFTTIRPEYSCYYDSILNFLYDNNENEFKKDINELNILNMFNKYIKKEINDKKMKITIDCNDDDFIIDHNNIIIKVTLSEKYCNASKCININDNNYIIQLHKNKHIINDQSIGEINVTILNKSELDFIQINDYDLLLTKKVSLSQYIYGSSIKFNHLDGEIISFEFHS